jgi:hypothetical protein
MNTSPWRYGFQCMALGYCVGVGAAIGPIMSFELRTFLIGWPIAIFVLGGVK